MSAQTIDFSKYATPEGQQAGGIDFSKYATPESATAAPAQQPGTPYQPGFLHQLGSTLANVFTHPPASVSPYPMMDTEAKQAIAQGARAEDVQRKQEGRSTAYRTIAPIGEAIGVNVPGQEEAMRHGDRRGILGAAVGSAGLAASPLAVEGVLRGANAVLPSRPRAGMGLNMLTDTQDATYANHPVPSPTALSEARTIEAEHATTGDKPPAKIQSFLNATGLNPEAARAQGFNPDLNMWEARTMLKRVNTEAFDPRTPKATADALHRFANALDTDITNAAQQGGFNEDYQRFKTEYRQGSNLERWSDLRPTEVSKRLLKEAPQRAVSAVVDRNAGPPQFTNKPPASLPPTPEAYTRMLLDAKEGKISEGEAARRIARAGGSNKTRPLPPPP